MNARAYPRILHVDRIDGREPDRALRLRSKDVSAVHDVNVSGTVPVKLLPFSCKSLQHNNYRPSGLRWHRKLLKTN